jgi:hypothetical protein
MVDICVDWFPEDALVLKLKTLSDSDAFFLLYSLASYVHAGQVRKIELPSFKKFISARDFLYFMQAVNGSTHALLAENFWKLEKDMWEEELMISPTSQAIRLILPEVDSEKKESFNGFELIPPTEIKEVSLRFSKETQASLDRLTNILTCCPTELWNTRRFGILLAGESGCGKSEYVLQLCRQLGFYCMSVGSLSSKWIGDTEKAISRVLEREYPRLMKEHDNKVILFLADTVRIRSSVTIANFKSPFSGSSCLTSVNKLTN